MEGSGHIEVSMLWGVVLVYDTKQSELYVFHTVCLLSDPDRSTIEFYVGQLISLSFL